MARISKSPEARKQEILDAAARLFAEKGYDETAVRDIVAAVGVAQGLFYYYFRSKEEVFFALAQQQAEWLIGEIADIISKEDASPLLRTREAIEAISSFFYEKGAQWSSIPKLITPSLNQRFYQMTVDMLEPYLVDLLTQGQAQGQFHITSPLQTSRFILAGFVAVFTKEMPPTPDAVVGMVQVMIERILALPVGALSGADGL